MTNDPYERGIARGRPPCSKTDVVFSMVVVLDTMRDNRGLALIHPQTRCVCRDEVHEVIGTLEDSGPGGTVNKVFGLGFAHVVDSGVIVVGDEVWWGGTMLGWLMGFDTTHIDNHINVLIRLADKGASGCELGLEVRDCLTFRSPAPQDGGEKCG